MLNIKKIFLISLSIFSLNAESTYICQPSDANGYEGYDDKTLYDGYFSYNVLHNYYTTYQVVQNTPGILQAEYWCLYQSDALYREHVNSCDLESGHKPVCSISIGGLVDGYTNFKPYVNPITNGDCLDQNVCLDIPQTLSVSVGESAVNDLYSSGVFFVESNGWVDFNFSGSSYNDKGEKVNTPYFYKAEVNANADLISNRYDQLNTIIGVRVSNAELLKQIENPADASWNSWELGSNNFGPEVIQPMGKPENFILPMSNSQSPGYAIGAFSPALTDGFKASVSVYAIASGNYTQQSGNYKMNITLNVTAREP